mmetsp:Transcript_57453/g.125838  ORF Transcript_57453/g.125838 Transcript_57453/m.125838 type:complete len:247 (-) Transcript_57453:1109-1849(-)
MAAGGASGTNTTTGRCSHLRFAGRRVAKKVVICIQGTRTDAPDAQMSKMCPPLEATSSTSRCGAIAERVRAGLDFTDSARGTMSSDCARGVPSGVPPDPLKLCMWRGLAAGDAPVTEIADISRSCDMKRSDPMASSLNVPIRVSAQGSRASSECANAKTKSESLRGCWGLRMMSSPIAIENGIEPVLPYTARTKSAQGTPSNSFAGVKPYTSIWLPRSYSKIQDGASLRGRVSAGSVRKILLSKVR